MNSIVAMTYDKNIEHLSQYNILDWNLYMPSPDHGKIPEEKVTVPYVVKSGHTKRVVAKIGLYISDKLFKKLKIAFNNEDFTLGNIHRLYRIGQKFTDNYIIFLEVRLSNGKTREESINIGFFS